MRYDPSFRYGRSIRLKGYDYSQDGAYFVTIVAQGRLCLFGEALDDAMHLNDAGKLVSDAWQWLETQYPYVALDEYVVMPNHAHGILVISDSREVGRGDSRIAPTGSDVGTVRKTLGRLIGAFKAVSAKHFNLARCTVGRPLWQRNYYEHIIRSEMELDRVRSYIQNNPPNWESDSENPAAISPTRP